MEELTLHKVTFSEEAIFDYEHCMFVPKDYSPYKPNMTADDWVSYERYELPIVIFKTKREIQLELEEYIQRHNRVKHQHYFKVRHWDDVLEDWILLFIRRGWKLSTMQNWTVVGICYEYDWNEDAEEDGLIRAWCDTKITDLKDEEDWAERLLARQEIAEMWEKLDKKEKRKYEKLYGRFA